MRTITLINDLIDQHEDYTKCSDENCKICTEIKKLSAPLNKDGSGKKIRQLIRKGADMTTSDVHYLIESGVRKNDIRKALKMTPLTFVEFLDDIGLKRKREGEEEMKISQVKYEELKHKGITDAQIAEKIGVSDATIYNYKKKWYPKVDENKSVKKQEYQEVKEKVAVAVDLDENVEKALLSRIKELELQAKEYPELINKVENLEDANILLGKENNRLLLLDDQKSKEINQLKDAATDLEDEIDALKNEVKAYEHEAKDWKSKAQCYAIENEGMSNQYQNINNAFESQTKELKLFRALLKEVL